MLRLLIEWLLNAVALVITAYVVPDFEVDGFGPALIAALVVGLLNVTLGWLLSILTFPLVWLLPRLMMLVIDAWCCTLRRNWFQGSDQAVSGRVYRRDCAGADPHRVCLCVVSRGRRICEQCLNGGTLSRDRTSNLA